MDAYLFIYRNYSRIEDMGTETNVVHYSRPNRILGRILQMEDTLHEQCEIAGAPFFQPLATSHVYM